MRFPDVANDDAGEAVIAFVLGYSSAGTRTAYDGDLAQWLRHCRSYGIDPMTVRRTDIERWHITPHSLRHSAITAALNAGVSLRDVQDFARHADPRTTLRYDRARKSLDRHASYAVMQSVSGAS